MAFEFRCRVDKIVLKCLFSYATVAPQAGLKLRNCSVCKEKTIQVLVEGSSDKEFDPLIHYTS